MPDFAKMANALASQSPGNSLLQNTGDVVPFPGGFQGTQMNNGPAPQLSLDALNQIIRLQQQHGFSDRQIIELLAKARGQLGYR